MVVMVGYVCTRKNDDRGGVWGSGVCMEKRIAGHFGSCDDLNICEKVNDNRLDGRQS